MNNGMNGDSPKEKESKSKNKNRKEKTEIFEKYNLYFEPIIITDSDFSIIYKNLSAKSHIKLQVRKNIWRLINAGSIGKLDNAIKNNMLCVVDFDLPVPFTRCVANLEEIEYPDGEGGIKREKIYIFIFFASINLAKIDRDYKSVAFNLIEAFNTQKSHLNEVIQYDLQNLKQPLENIFESFKDNKDIEESRKQLKFVTANQRKMMRLQSHFNAYITNINKGLNGDINGQEKARYDIVKFFRKLKIELDKYMRNSGYALTLDMKDEKFIAKIFEKDFFLMNVIIITFALKYAEANTVHQKFMVEHDVNRAVMRYEFGMNEKFIGEYSDRVAAEYLLMNENPASMDWIDLKLASIIAGNNNSELEIKTDFDSKKIAVEITIAGSQGDDANDELRGSPVSIYEVMAEWIQEMLDIEFSEINQ